jgi:hypothetical protein
VRAAEVDMLDSRLPAPLQGPACSVDRQDVRYERSAFRRKIRYGLMWLMALSRGCERARNAWGELKAEKYIDRRDEQQCSCVN